MIVHTSFLYTPFAKYQNVKVPTTMVMSLMEALIIANFPEVKENLHHSENQSDAPLESLLSRIDTCLCKVLHKHPTVASTLPQDSTCAVG